MHDQTIADLDLGCLCLRRTASTCALFGRVDRFDTIVERMIAPEAWRTAPPSLPTAFLVDYGRLGLSRTGKPAGLHTLEVLSDALGLFRLGGAVGHGRLLGQLARVYDEKAYLCHVLAPVSILHGHATDDTLPMPATRRLLTSTARFFE